MNRREALGAMLSVPLVGVAEPLTEDNVPDWIIEAMAGLAEQGRILQFKYATLARIACILDARGVNWTISSGWCQEFGGMILYCDAGEKNLTA